MRLGITFGRSERRLRLLRWQPRPARSHLCVARTGRAGSGRRHARGQTAVVARINAASVVCNLLMHDQLGLVIKSGLVFVCQHLSFTTIILRMSVVNGFWLHYAGC